MAQAMMMEEKVRNFFKNRFPEAVIKIDDFRGDLSFYIKPESLLPVCEALVDDPEFDVRLLSDITCVDWFEHDEAKSGRFEIIYNIYSLTHCFRFFLKVRLDGETPHLPTLTNLWAGANWLEREVFDLFGIFFDDHPDMTKILTPDDLEGHPLRKDFPLTWEQPVFTWNKDNPPEVIK